MQAAHTNLTMTANPSDKRRTQQQSPAEPQIDYSALRVNAALTALLLSVALTSGIWAFVAYVSAVLLISALYPPMAQFTLFYFRFLKSAGIVKPDVRTSRPEPHLFAQLLGGILTLLATLALLAHVQAAGVLLVWVVLGLALLQLLTGICVGCQLYAMFQRLGIPGFNPPSDPAR